MKKSLMGYLQESIQCFYKQARLHAPGKSNKYFD